MRYTYRFTKEAQKDVSEACLWYEKQRKGLGNEFIEALDHCKESILLNPEMYQIVYKKRVRKFVINRFPYMVLYLVERSQLIVLSVFNTHQASNKWKVRT